MSRIRLILSLIVGVINLCNAQIKTSVITQAQILELQKLPVSQVTDLLSKGGWSVEKNQRNQLKEYFIYELGYKVDKWVKMAGNQWEGSILIYYRTGYPNMVIYQTSELNFTSLKPSNIQPMKEKDFEITIITKYGLAMEFRDYFNDNSHKRYSILCYDMGSVKNLVSKAKREKKEENVKIKTEEAKEAGEKERMEMFNLALASGNRYFNRNEFDKAVAQYRSARNYLHPGEKDKLADLTTRIQNAEKGKSPSFEKYKKDADEYFVRRNTRNHFQIMRLPSR